jgi:DNA-binding transcriptional ArsR family regulator
MAVATKLEKSPAMALSHPNRVRILEVLNELDMSATQFARAGYVGEVDDNLLSNVGYHFKELAEYGALVVVDTQRVGGAIEITYRGAARAYFGDSEWAAIDEEERRAFSRVMYGGLFARVEGAMLKGTFDKRTDRWLVWRSMSLDERGWSEVNSLFHRTDAEIEAIQRGSNARLAESGDAAVPATVGLLSFESPVVGE